MKRIPRRMCVLLLLMAAACGRSGLDADADGLDPSGAADAARGPAGGDARAGGDGRAADAPASTDTAATSPDDDAGSTSSALCPSVPPRAATCPRDPPSAPMGCALPGSTCAYVEARGSETVVAVFHCTVVAEDFVGWKESDVPCAEACIAFAIGGAEDGGTTVGGPSCLDRPTVPCDPPQGESAQIALDDALLSADCPHHEGSGGFTVLFDPDGCAASIRGGTFSACDVEALAQKRFACAVGHPCAVAPALVR